MLSSSSFFIFVSPDQQEGEAVEMQILGLPHPDQGVSNKNCSFTVPNQVDINWSFLRLRHPIVFGQKTAQFFVSLYFPQESFSFPFLFSWCCPSIRFLSLFPRSTWRRSDGNADSWTATPRSRCLTYNLLVLCTKPSRYQLKFSSFKTPDCFWA